MQSPTISPPPSPPSPVASASTETARHQLPADWKLRPPLSPLTYYRRNVWRVLPVGAAIMISVFLIAAIVTLVNSIDASIRVNYGLLQKFSVLAPQFETDVPGPILDLAKKAPGTRRVVQGLPYFVPIKTLFGEMPVPIYGVAQDDIKTMMNATGNRLVEGRLPKLNEPELLLSRGWANNLGVKVGDTHTFSSERMPTITEAQRVVGIMEGGELFAITDQAYLLLTLPEVVQRPFYIFLPEKPSDLPKISAHLDSLTEDPGKFGLEKKDVAFLRVFTFQGLVDELRRGLQFLYVFLAIADILVIGAVALLSGFLANIYFEQRLGEFGLLSALGFRRERLARRLIAETGSLVLFSWGLGVILTAVFIGLLDRFYMTPNGLILSQIGFDALLFTLPTPIFVGLASLGTVLLRLYKLDPIEIMERR